MNLLKIDDVKLKKQIDGFQELYEKLPYIVCSEKTFDKLEEDRDDVFKIPMLNNNVVLKIEGLEVKTIHKKDYSKAMYYGCHVLINNELSLGEIEVR